MEALVGGEIQQIVADVCRYIPPGFVLPAAWVHSDCQQALQWHLDIPRHQALACIHATSESAQTLAPGLDRVIAPGINSFNDMHSDTVTRQTAACRGCDALSVH